MRRFSQTRYAKIVATLGPASSDPEKIRSLFLAGVDVFRINFSHGAHEQHARDIAAIRRLERELERPIGVLMDLQGPKLRIGRFKDGPIELEAGAAFCLDQNSSPGNESRVKLPHPEIFSVLKTGTTLLLDDGRLELQVKEYGPAHALTTVVVGGQLSDNKGVNVPGEILPLSALTVKDLQDLEYGLGLGVDWVALSFVQRSEDLSELHELVEGRARILAKLEKPAAIAQLDEIVDAADAIMVARGDLGVEMPPEKVPTIQKRILRSCRKAGKPVIVATKMLDSMTQAPVPTRAEAADVATAVYDGADAVMLSGETAVGAYPEAAVAMMHRIISEVECDPQYRIMVDTAHPGSEETTADAITCATHNIASLLPVSAIVVYTASGSSSLRMARERPEAQILSLSPVEGTGRYLTLVWGVHSAYFQEINTVTEMVHYGCQFAKQESFTDPQHPIVIIGGMPFGCSGKTNLLRLAWPEQELADAQSVDQDVSAFPIQH